MKINHKYKLEFVLLVGCTIHIGWCYHERQRFHMPNHLYTTPTNQCNICKFSWICIVAILLRRNISTSSANDVIPRVYMDQRCNIRSPLRYPIDRSFETLGREFVFLTLFLDSWKSCGRKKRTCGRWKHGVSDTTRKVLCHVYHLRQGHPSPFSRGGGASVHTFFTDLLLINFPIISNHLFLTAVCHDGGERVGVFSGCFLDRKNLNWVLKLNFLTKISSTVKMKLLDSLRKEMIFKLYLL